MKKIIVIASLGLMSVSGIQAKRSIDLCFSKEIVEGSDFEGYCSYESDFYINYRENMICSKNLKSTKRGDLYWEFDKDGRIVTHDQMGENENESERKKNIYSTNSKDQKIYMQRIKYGMKNGKWIELGAIDTWIFNANGYLSTMINKDTIIKINYDKKHLVQDIYYKKDQQNKESFTYRKDTIEITYHIWNDERKRWEQTGSRKFDKYGFALYYEDNETPLTYNYTFYFSGKLKSVTCFYVREKEKQQLWTKCYDKKGRLTEIQNGAGETIQKKTFDKKGHLIDENNLDKRLHSIYVYNGDILIECKTYRNDQLELVNTYNQYGDIKETITYWGGKEEKTIYENTYFK